MLSLLALMLLGQGTVAPSLPAQPAATESAATRKAASSSTPVPAESVEVIYYGGKRVIYNADEAKVFLMDSAWVRYQDMKLNSDSIVYDIDRHRLNSYHRSVFRTAQDSVVGTELHYDVDTRKGYMTLAATEVGQGFFSGRDLWLVKQKTLDVDNGAYTTCDLPHPHYRFWGREVRVYLEDMVVAEPLVLELRAPWNNRSYIPIVAAPFWFFPISQKRKSGFLPFKVGYDAVEGFYGKNIAWYWAINDYSDATFAADVMSKKGVMPSFEGVYAVGPFASGRVTGTYISEADTKNRRYTLNAQHNSMFLLGTKLNATADFESDTSFVADYSENQVQWLKKELDSYASLSRSFKGIGSVNLTARRHTDLQNHRTDISFPSFGASFVGIPLFKNWNLTSSVNAANAQTDIVDTLGTLSFISRTVSPSFSLALPQRLGFSIPLSGSYSDSRSIRHRDPAQIGTPERVSGNYSDSGGIHHRPIPADSTFGVSRIAQAGTGLSLSHNLFGFLNLSEGFSYSQNVHFAESTYAQAGYGLNAASSFALNRIFALDFADLHGLLHKVTPSVSYNFTPQTRSHGFFGEPRFDTVPAASLLGMGLGNDFQVKVGPDEQKVDLGNLNLNSSYDFTTHHLSPIGANLDLNLTDIIAHHAARDTTDDSTQKHLLQAGRQQNASLTISTGTTFDPESLKFSGYSVNTRFTYDLAFNDTAGNAGPKYRIGLSHFLSKQQDMLNLDLHATPPGWTFGVTGGWNIKDHRITDYTIDIVKDLHCWEAVGSVSRLGDRWTYDFKIRIKAIPDVAIGKGLFGSLLP
jgi:hypothetical protein